MKRITFVASYSLRLQPAIRNRLTAYINEGLAQGYSIRLISPDCDLPELAAHPDLELVSVSALRNHGASFVKRALAEVVTAWRALYAARRYRDEHVVITIPSMFLLFLSPFFGGRKCYLDVRDLSWEYLSDQSFYLRYIKLCFRCLAKLAIKLKRYRFVIITNEMDQYFVTQELHVPKERALLIYNGVTRKQFEILSSSGRHRTSSNPSASATGKGHRSPITVSYIGNVGLAQNLMTLVQAAQQLSHITFNIVGAGSDCERIYAKVDVLGLKNVKLWGQVAWEQIPYFYASSDILYAQLTCDYARAMPSKLYEYLSTGRFIIYGGGAQAKKILSSFENYVVVPPDDVDALVASISDFERHQYPESATNRQLIEELFIREDNARRLYSNLQASK